MDQVDAIRTIVDGPGRLLVVQKTGWGKSFVYFIAAKLLREQGYGPTLLFSPLLALMRNQLAAAETMGVRAARIDSESAAAWREIEWALARDEVDILLISPERLANDRFQAEVLSGMAARTPMLVIDEAHCISDWGHDFRPQYRLIERIIRGLPPNLRVLATTATANDRVVEDLTTALGPGLRVLRGDLDRPSLTLQTIRLPGQAERLAWLADQLATLEEHGIIYALTKRDAEQVAAWLQRCGFAVEAYTSDTGAARVGLEHALLGNRVKALVATSALGMGYDKPDLSFVIHYQMPGSVVAYYQQVGRAGRALPSAYGILLSGQEEGGINDWFIQSAFPTRDEVTQVMDAIEAAPEGLSLPELAARANVGWGRIEKTLQLLSLESPAPIAKQGTRWQLTTTGLSAGFWDRAARLTRLRQEEQRQMRAYVDLPFGDHMAFLVAALDGGPAGVVAPSLPPLPAVPSAASVQEALAFLKRTDVEIPPRVKWPAGGLPRFGVRGAIRVGLRARAGRALCVWGDSGWGGMVRLGKYRDARFSDALVTASADMLRRWQPDPAPEWLTCVPSLRHPHLVPDFARRLAVALSLPFHAVIRCTEERPEQKTMANSAHQARNLDGAFEVTGAVTGTVTGEVPRGPVLLVDDMTDSGWTFTVGAYLLCRAGGGPVWPMALAKMGPDE